MSSGLAVLYCIQTATNAPRSSRDQNCIQGQLCGPCHALTEQHSKWHLGSALHIVGKARGLPAQTRSVLHLSWQLLTFSLRPSHSSSPAAILKHLGVITNTTRLAGTSGGAISALQVCSDTQFRAQAFQDNLMLANLYRPQKNCMGFFDKALSEVLEARTSQNVSDCSGRLWVSITSAQPANQSDENVLVSDAWGNRSHALAAIRLSSYFPGVSGASAPLRLPAMEPTVEAGYDGGFSQSLPCPPGETKVPIDNCSWHHYRLLGICRCKASSFSTRCRLLAPFVHITLSLRWQSCRTVSNR